MGSRSTGAVPEDGWRIARLITADGIRGSKERESRATSALLSVMMIVPDFARSLLAYAGAPRGEVATFTEVPLEPARERRSNGRAGRPDGAIVVKRGRTRWSCLVEVKTGGDMQTEEQVGTYLDLAREHGFDAVMTVSNEIAAEPGVSPLRLSKAQLRDVRLVHLSWWRVLTEAVIQHKHHGVDDPEQARVLDDLIAFLRDARTGTGHFEDLGANWVRVRDGARNGTLVHGPECDSVVAGWEDFVRYVCLGLSQSLGADVAPVYPRKRDVPARRAEASRQVVEAGCLDSTIRVPRAVGDIDIRVDLRAQQVTTAVRVPSPDGKRPLTRIKRMVDQLDGAPEDLRIEVRFRGVATTSKCLLNEAREYPECLLHPTDPKREPRDFTVALTRRLAVPKGTDERSFVATTRRQINEFYGQVVQGLVRPTPKAPQMPASEPDHADSAASDTKTDEATPRAAAASVAMTPP